MNLKEQRFLDFNSTGTDLSCSCDYCTYEGLKVKGSIYMVFNRGNLIAKENEFLGTKGYGRFIPRKINK